MTGISGTGRTGTTYPIVFIGDVAELLVGAFDPPSADAGSSTVAAADGDVALRDVLDRLRAGSRTGSAARVAGRREPEGHDLPAS
jgi:hypothetical protein